MKLRVISFLALLISTTANAGEMARCEDINVDSMGFALDKNSSPFTGTVECQRSPYLSVKTTYRDGFKEGEEKHNVTDAGGNTWYIKIYKYKKGTAYELCSVEPERKMCFPINCAEENCKTP